MSADRENAVKLTRRMQVWLRVVAARGGCAGCLAAITNDSLDDVEICSMWGSTIQLVGQRLLAKVYPDLGAGVGALFGVGGIVEGKTAPIAATASRFVAASANGDTDTATVIWEVGTSGDRATFLHGVATAFSGIALQLHALGGLDPFLRADVDG